MPALDETPHSKTSNSLDDWLDMHGLTVTRCSTLLQAAEDGLIDKKLPRLPRAIGAGSFDATMAWQRALAALMDYFPTHAESISNAYEVTGKIQAAGAGKAPRALTVADGGGGFPVVYFSFDGGAGGHMAIAHEFAHAVQAVCSRGIFIPPVTREICAFVGEAALLEYIRPLSREDYTSLLVIWRRDDYVYCHHYASVLKAALREPAAKYSYAWNYPIARFLAQEAKRKLPPDDVWGLFEDREDLGGLMAALGY